MSSNSNSWLCNSSKRWGSKVDKDKFLVLKASREVEELKVFLALKVLRLVEVQQMALSGKRLVDPKDLVTDAAYRAGQIDAYNEIYGELERQDRVEQND